MNEDKKDKQQYQDMISLPHHVSDHHEPMSVPDRAAQFSPFAAVTGYDGAVKETARLTDQRIELDEIEKTKLDEKLRIVQEQLSEQQKMCKPEQVSTHQEVEIVFFEPDELKAGGTYISKRGIVKKIDRYEHAVLLQDGTRILIKEIVNISGEIFQSLDDFFA